MTLIIKSGNAKAFAEWRASAWRTALLLLATAGMLGLLAFAFTGNWWFAAPAAVLVVCARIVGVLLPRGSVVNPSS